MKTPPEKTTAHAQSAEKLYLLLRIEQNKDNPTDVYRSAFKTDICSSISQKEANAKV